VPFSREHVCSPAPLHRGIAVLAKPLPAFTAFLICHGTRRYATGIACRHATSLHGPRSHRVDVPLGEGYATRVPCAARAGAAQHARGAAIAPPLRATRRTLLLACICCWTPGWVGLARRCVPARHTALTGLLLLAARAAAHACARLILPPGSAALALASTFATPRRVPLFTHRSSSSRVVCLRSCTVVIASVDGWRDQAVIIGRRHMVLCL
jgi:hypothetical protein